MSGWLSLYEASCETPNKASHETLHEGQLDLLPRRAYFGAANMEIVCLGETGKQMRLPEAALSQQVPQANALGERTADTLKIRFTQAGSSDPDFDPGRSMKVQKQ